MAPRFGKNMYQTYGTTKGVAALICFTNAKIDFIFPFRDKLVENMLQTHDLYMQRSADEPLVLDSSFYFFSPENKEAAKAFSTNKKPGFLSRILRTKAWNEHKTEKQRLRQLMQIEMYTSHDYPCIDFYSSVHKEDELKLLIEHVAKEIGIGMQHNPKLPPMSDILMTNKNFDQLPAT